MGMPKMGAKRFAVVVLGLTVMQGLVFPHVALGVEDSVSVPTYTSSTTASGSSDAAAESGDSAAGDTDVLAESKASKETDSIETSETVGDIESGDNAGSTSSFESVGDFESAIDSSPADESEPADDSLQEPVSGWQSVGGETYWYRDGQPVCSELIAVDGEKYWLESDCTLARSKEIYDPASDAWYWVDSDGTVATGKDVYIPAHDKWVRYDGQGRMIKGEDYRYGGWYYFDPVTGAMAKGMRFIPSNGGKWVYYDVVTGQMAHGERYVDYDREHTGWYHFDEHTGAMSHGFVYLTGGKKWVYYDEVTGIMQYGERNIDGGWYYLTPGTGAVDYEWAWIPGKNKWVYYDPVTGRMVYGGVLIDGKPYYLDKQTGARWSKSQIVSKLVATARSYYGKHPDCPGALAANGGLLCPFGPCMSYVWYVFHQAGLDVFLCDGAKTGWPHHNYDWYRTRGRVNMKAQVGDIAFYKFPETAWSKNYSASHAGIVVRVDNGGVWVADAINDGIGEHYSYSCILGYAHPYYG